MGDGAKMRSWVTQTPDPRPRQERLQRQGLPLGEGAEWGGASLAPSSVLLGIGRGRVGVAGPEARAAMEMLIRTLEVGFQPRGLGNVLFGQAPMVFSPAALPWPWWENYSPGSPCQLLPLPETVITSSKFPYE